MRRLALAALAAAACTNPQVEHPSGPLDSFFYPTGLAVLDHRLFVASSNADLTFSPDTGGSVISVDPLANPIRVTGALDIESFSGELGIADATSCPAIADRLAAQKLGALAFVPIRGSNFVYRLGVGTDGSISCANCGLPVGSTERGDPFAIGIACDDATAPGGPKVARAFVGYLRSSGGQAWLTQIDLTLDPTDPLYVQHNFWDVGTLKAFAYDRTRRRVYFTRSVTGSPETLRYADLTYGAPTAEYPGGKPCPIGLYYSAGGCMSDATPSGSLPPGIELRGIALANNPDPASTTRRAYLSARVYDAAAAASAGYAVGDYEGLLLVVDLTTSPAGRLTVNVVNQVHIGFGAAYVRVLPARAGKRDVVAVIAIDDGSVWIYDDETGNRVAFNRDPATGTPLVGEGPFGLAVDPVALPGSVTASSPSGVARVYAGSFRQHWVTAIDVPLDDPASACIVSKSGQCATAPADIGRIAGGGNP